MSFKPKAISAIKQKLLAFVDIFAENCEYMKRHCQRNMQKNFMTTYLLSAHIIPLKLPEIVYKNVPKFKSVGRRVNMTIDIKAFKAKTENSQVFISIFSINGVLKQNFACCVYSRITFERNNTFLSKYLLSSVLFAVFEQRNQSMNNDYQLLIYMLKYLLVLSGEFEVWTFYANSTFFHYRLRLMFQVTFWEVVYQKSVDYSTSIIEQLSRY